ncbi:MAG: M1 family metallopeptidase [Balneolaceae bacterium]
MKNILLLFSLLTFPSLTNAQFFQEVREFTRQDTLRGSITPERAWWDLTYYHLDVAVDLEDSTISGTNTIQYQVDSNTTNIMQIDLQEPMFIESVEQNGISLEFERDGHAYFITLKKEQIIGEVNELVVQFDGKPLIAARPPWDGGLTWTRDENGNPFIANANQKIGASIWWPNKDHPYDEVDSMLISVTIPEDLKNVSNGRLRKVEEHNDGTKTWNWFVSNPINSYGVNINIGDYVNFKETFDGEVGPLDMDYWVLSYNKEKAIAQFADAPRTIKALEYWFGPYPFYEDSYKLVEAPYLGMEHQSSVTYGNRYENGYLGTDLSASGWGLKFDFIIVHETGHEWFANNITYADIADMWIHESFTHYSEYLFLEYHFGEKAASEYQKGVRLRISNDIPIIGTYGVHKEGSGDMYYKGANMLHMIRQIYNNDELWRATLRGLNKDFYHQTVSTIQIENYLSEALGIDLTPVFDQYLRDIRIPILEYSFKEGLLYYRWGSVVSDFDMPVDVFIDGNETRIRPTTVWQGMESFGKELIIDPDFYVGKINILGN